MTRKLACAAALIAAAPAAGGGGLVLETECVATGLTEPVLVTYAPGDEDRLFVIEVDGWIRIVDRKTGELYETPFLDMTEHINPAGAGVLGLAFHPSYDENGYFYVHYAGGESFQQSTIVISRFTVSADDMNVADPDSEHLILTFDAPGAAHRGGWVGFGNDGNFYASFGDGGDPCNATELESDHLFSRLIRIDVNGDAFPEDPLRNYRIPADNPFVDASIRDETWVYGLRQPWGMSFDRATGDVYIGDVGQSGFEELSYLPGDAASGRNLGWPCREGTGPGVPQCAPDELCDEETMVPPVHEYPHDGFIPAAIIGGEVYRGSQIPALDGTYFFADLYGTFWTLRMEDGAATQLTDRTLELDPGNPDSPYISDISSDAAGELYVIEYNLGEIWRIVAAPTCDADLNGDGVVAVADLVIILLSWGTDHPTADLNGDGFVGFDDLLALIQAWGACP